MMECRCLNPSLEWHAAKCLHSYCHSAMYYFRELHFGQFVYAESWTALSKQVKTWAEFLTQM
jgi:hypothetical protein